MPEFDFLVKKKSSASEFDFLVKPRDTIPASDFFEGADPADFAPAIEPSPAQVPGRNVEPNFDYFSLLQPQPDPEEEFRKFQRNRPGAVFGRQIGDISREISSNAQSIIEDTERFTGVPRSQYATGEVTPNQERYRSLNSFQKVGSDLLRTGVRGAAGLAGFITGIPGMLFDPEGSIEERVEGEDPITTLLKQEGGGLLQMISDLPIQIDYVLKNKLLGFKDPSVGIQWYKDAVTRFYEAPESPLFAAGILRGGFKTAVKTKTALKNVFSDTKKTVLMEDLASGEPGYTPTKSAEKSAFILDEVLKEADQINKSVVGREGLFESLRSEESVSHTRPLIEAERLKQIEDHSSFKKSQRNIKIPEMPDWEVLRIAEMSKGEMSFELLDLLGEKRAAEISSMSAENMRHTLSNGRIGTPQKAPSEIGGVAIKDAVVNRVFPQSKITGGTFVSESKVFPFEKPPKPKTIKVITKKPSPTVKIRGLNVPIGKVRKLHRKISGKNRLLGVGGAGLATSALLSDDDNALKAGGLVGLGAGLLVTGGIKRRPVKNKLAFSKSKTLKITNKLTTKEQLVKDVLAEEPNHYPVPKAIEAARNKHLGGKSPADASPKLLQSYLTHIKGRKTRVGKPKTLKVTKAAPVETKPQPAIEIVDSKPQSPTELKIETGFIARAKAAIGKGNEFRKLITNQAKSVFKVPEAKKELKNLEGADEFWKREVGEALEELRGTELHQKKGLFKKYKGEQIADMIESGEASGINKVFDNFHRKLKAVGINLGYIGLKNGLKYFPRILKRSIAKIIQADIEGVIKIVKESGNTSDKSIIASLEKKQTKKIIKHLIDSKQVSTYQDALRRLEKLTEDNLLGHLSFLEKRNKSLEFPSSFYERDARIVVKWYVNAASKRIAETKTWGIDGIKLSESLVKIGDIDPIEAKRLRDLHDIWSGEYDKKHGLKGIAGGVVETFVAAEFASKIAGGTATIPNITQTLISTFPDLGVGRGLVGIVKLLTSKGRAKVRTSGALNQNLLYSVLGRDSGSLLSKATQVLGRASGFTGINKFNMSLAASTMEIAVKKWYGIANKKGGFGFRKKWANERLKQYGVDPTKPLTEKIILEKMYRFATDSQLQRNVLNDPIWFNSPWARPFVIFKRFGYRQMVRRREMLLHDIKARDPLPTLRLIAGGLAGGEFVVWAKNLIFEGISGQPYYRKEDLLSWERALNNLIAVGSGGFLTDMVDFSESQDIPSALKSTVSSAGFAATPVGASDIYQAHKAITMILDNWTKYGDLWYAVQRSTKPAARITGSLSGSLAKRLAPDAQKKSRLKYKLSLEKRELLRLISIGEGKEAVRLITLWNKNHPSTPITMEDISLKKIKSYMIGRAKKKAEAKQ